jgi:hypothetical protein
MYCNRFFYISKCFVKESIAHYEKNAFFGMANILAMDPWRKNKRRENSKMLVIG